MFNVVFILALFVAALGLLGAVYGGFLSRLFVAICSGSIVFGCAYGIYALFHLKTVDTGGLIVMMGIPILGLISLSALPSFLGALYRLFAPEISPNKPDRWLPYFIMWLAFLVVMLRISMFTPSDHLPRKAKKHHLPVRHDGRNSNVDKR